MIDEYLTWDAGRRYAAFADLARRTATIVSSVVDGDASSMSLDTCRYVVGSDGAVCDVEIAADGSGDQVEPSGSMGSEFQKVEGRLRTTVERTSVTFVRIAEDWLIVSIGGSREGRWVALGDSPLYLRIDGDRLIGFAFCRPQLDADGSRESAWLDEIGA